MRRAAALAAVAVALGGCGGDDRRDAAVAYIEEANRAQADLAPAHEEAQAAIRVFARGRFGERSAARLQEASSTMNETRAALELVKPPPEARALHAHLLELLDLQARVTLELSLAAAYLPETVDGIGAADDAGSVLARALRTAQTGPAQAEALEEYAAEIDRTLGALGRLGPPPVLRPWHDAQVSRLRASHALASGLAGGIRRDDRGAVDRALRTFSEQGPAGALAQRAQREAVAVFNEQLEQQQELLATIDREQAALAAEFGS